ncbi:MAG: ECF-type sigma factor [Planctomycetaceae bacterium]
MTAPEITQILNRMADGDRQAVDELIPIVYQQMKRIASNQLDGEDKKAGDPTELVHEAYIRLIGNEKLAWQSRSHFFGACATVIRRILVDQARARKTAKRGAGEAVLKLEDHLVAEAKSVDLVELDDALQELETLAPRQVRLIELRYFGGLSETEAAEILKVSRRTVSGDWAMAKAWLQFKLK